MKKAIKMSKAQKPQLGKTDVSGSLSKSEKKVIELLKKIDELAKEKDFQATVFGQSGYSLYLLKNPTKEEIDLESRNQYILKDRIIWKSESLIGDGGDADFS